MQPPDFALQNKACLKGIRWWVATSQEPQQALVALSRYDWRSSETQHDYCSVVRIELTGHIHAGVTSHPFARVEFGGPGFRVPGLELVC